MKQLLRRLGLALLLVFGVAASLHAAEPQTYVVIVGVNQYAGDEIKPRPKAEADALAVYALFADKQYATGAAPQVRLLLGSAGTDKPVEGAPASALRASRENLQKSIHWAFSSAAEEDAVFLFWFGQGGPFGDRTCYFSADTKFEDGKFQEVVTAADLEQEFDKCKSQRVAVFLDVHFRGYTLPNGKVNESGLQNRFQEFLGKDDEDDQLSRPIVFLSANEGIQPTFETPKNGLFAQIVIEALSGKADKDGGEADSQITVDELLTYVEKELPRRSRLDFGKAQYPILVKRNSYYALTRNPEAATVVDARLKKFEELAAGKKLSAEIVREGRDLLSLMPRFETQRQLRKAYQNFADGKIDLDELLKERQAYLSTLTLPRKTAEEFAENVLRVAKITQDGYVKPVELKKLVSEAVKGLYRFTNTKLPPELAERMEKLSNSDQAGLKKFLADAREHLGNRDDLKGSKATDVALQRMLHSLDPYSTYIDAEALHAFEIGTKQEFIGVGIQIQKDVATDMIRVSTPLRGSPAFKAGIATGDIIVRIINTHDGKGNVLEKPEVVETKGLSTSDVVKKILGKEGTPVTLVIRRQMTDGEKELSFELRRSRIQVETVLGVNRKDDPDAGWNYWIDPDSRIAYIRLTQFALNTERDLKKTLSELEKEGLRGLILDLRFNPGGYLDSAVGIADLFIDDGTIVSIRPRVGRSREFKGQHAGSKTDFPLVVLINGGSASASEIVSACIQDHERGIVMGERSFGKGSVQNIMEIDLGNGPSELKLTTASFWRPSGKNLHKFPTSKPEDDWGVMPHPNYTLKLSPAETTELFDHLRRQEIIPRRDPPKMETTPTFVDRQLEMAVDYLKKQLASKTASKPGGQ
ncbi:MAG: S41 family peptidase [Gemmatales bacterium]|nr:S41 family peptidase [Gemmatales bacterium]MDW8387069.1 S41 family peptidase [Gemmatales bacterium]